MIQPAWSERNLIFKDYDIENKNIIDFGCGDKSILNYLNFKSYIGYDISSHADFHVDFNKEFKIDNSADIGLILGVLEYLDSPDIFLKTIKETCDRFIIMILERDNPKTWHGWKQAFNENSFNALISSNFENFEIKRVSRYLIADINNTKLS